MAIPNYETTMKPLLELMADGQEKSMNDVVESLAQHFKLSDEERKVLLPSGQQFTFDSRVGWARTYMKKALLLESTKRSHIQITKRGLELLKENLETIDSKLLMRYEEFKEFRIKSNKNKEKDVSVDYSDEIKSTPEEIFQDAYESLKTNLVQEILENVKNCSPKFFEKLVVELLVKMGYGGTLQDAGKAVGQSGDGGIDGVIKEDRLGLDTVYIQAKRWNDPVGRPEIQKFAGALQGERAKKGVFITTSDFRNNAVEYVDKLEIKIALIDGQKLAEYMIDFDIGVSKVLTYDLKKLDSDYFIED